MLADPHRPKGVFALGMKMKSLTVLFLLNMIILASPAWGQVPDIWYRFETGANDEMGNLNAVLNGTTTGSVEFIEGASAAVFDGIDDSVDIPDSTLVNLGIHAQRTISLWVYSTRLASGMMPQLDQCEIIR